jgi:hypothetical protein
MIPDGFAEWFDHEQRRVLRGLAIVWRLADIEKWIAAIKQNPSDVRNALDLRPTKNGGTFESRETALDSLLDHVAAVRKLHQAGDWEMAQHSLNALDARVRQVNARVTDPLIASGQRSKAAGRKGGEARAARIIDRDVRMAKVFLSQRGTKPDSALKEGIARAEGLQRSAGIAAIDRGVAKIDSEK